MSPFSKAPLSMGWQQFVKGMGTISSYLISLVLITSVMGVYLPV